MFSLPKSSRTLIAGTLVCAAVGLGLAGAASAGVIATGDAIDAQQVTQARARLKALAQRPEVARELRLFGATPIEARARVDALTDAEVQAVAGKVGVLPAGGALSNNDLTLILVLIILILLL